MAKIECFRFLGIHKKPCEYIFKKTNKLTNKAKAILKKYSNLSYYNEICKRKDYVTYLIYVDGLYSGYIEMEPSRYYKQFYIKQIFLNEEVRGNGYSKILFNFAVNDIKENFKKIITISAIPGSMQGKRFLESVGFIPDVFYCSKTSGGSFSIYYLYEKDVFVLDKKEYELICGNTYDYKLCGVRRYIDLVNKAKEKDSEFSIKNYNYYLTHFKKERKVVKKEKKKTKNKFDGLFTTVMGDIPTFDDFGMVEEKKEVPCMFSEEYLNTYKDIFE